jgi:hypothetical protein
MKAEQVIQTRLTSFAGVTAIVGASPARVYPIVLPQKPILPAIVYRRVSSERIEGVYSDPGMARVRIQITSWADKYTDVKNLAEQVRLALERFGSAVSGTPIAGVTVFDIHMGSEVDDYVPEVMAYAVATDFTVVHLE